MTRRQLLVIAVVIVISDRWDKVIEGATRVETIRNSLAHCEYFFSVARHGLNYSETNNCFMHIRSLQLVLICVYRAKQSTQFIPAEVPYETTLFARRSKVFENCCLFVRTLFYIATAHLSTFGFLFYFQKFLD